ncbi:MAG TPA: T9SS type A sorting domain-containing protein [Bacteroidales bacterium]|nr:T9SS type A sorting domain-containing protein [Bacteroidales bacterium]
MKKLTILILVILSMSLIVNAQMKDNSNLLCSAEKTVFPDGGKNTKSNAQTCEITANPSEEIVSVKFNVNSNIESIKMIDNKSGIVFETGKSRGAAGSVIDIPIDDMEAGTYFIRVQTESGVQVQRIIISK